MEHMVDGIDMNIIASVVHDVMKSESDNEQRPLTVDDFSDAILSSVRTRRMVGKILNLIENSGMTTMEVMNTVGMLSSYVAVMDAKTNIMNDPECILDALSQKASNSMESESSDSGLSMIKMTSSQYFKAVNMFKEATGLDELPEVMTKELSSILRECANKAISETIPSAETVEPGPQQETAETVPADFVYDEKDGLSESQ
jgi:hypothetical protein